jgi:hypothetical protein
MKTIEENNRMIAEFMGASKQDIEDTSEFEMYGVIPSIEDGEFEQHFFLPLEMKFHASWDWLIPVLQKIDDLEIEVDENSNLIGDITHGLVSLDIQMTYEAAAKLIEFANENQIK